MASGGLFAPSLARNIIVLALVCVMALYTLKFMDEVKASEQNAAVNANQQTITLHEPMRSAADKQKTNDREAQLNRAAVTINGPIAITKDKKPNTYKVKAVLANVGKVAAKLTLIEYFVTSTNDMNASLENRKDVQFKRMGNALRTLLPNETYNVFVGQIPVLPGLVKRIESHKSRWIFAIKMVYEDGYGTTWERLSTQEFNADATGAFAGAEMFFVGEPSWNYLKEIKTESAQPGTTDAQVSSEEPQKPIVDADINYPFQLTYLTGVAPSDGLNTVIGKTRYDDRFKICRLEITNRKESNLYDFKVLVTFDVKVEDAQQVDGPKALIVIPNYQEPQGFGNFDSIRTFSQTNEYLVDIERLPQSIPANFLFLVPKITNWGSGNPKPQERPKSVLLQGNYTIRRGQISESHTFSWIIYAQEIIGSKW